MRSIPLDPTITPPRNVRTVSGLVALARTTIPQLCALAGIRQRVTSGAWNPIVLHAGAEHFRGSRTSYVGVGAAKRSDRVQALRALEVLAHGFHDYAARECVCGQGLFAAPARRGRPPIGSRAMTAKERMRRMRARADQD